MNGDVPGDGATGNSSGSAAGGDNGGSGDEATWLDLVARFEAPETGDGGTPWPEREDLTDTIAPRPVIPGPVPAGPPADPSGLPGPTRTSTGAGAGARDAPSRPDGQDADQEHYVPPPPPPLPKIDPVTKGAWMALFGGPCYLLLATIFGWGVSGLAAFCCVAAFVGGFAVLVLRMDNGGGPRDSGPDDGAVV